MPFLPMLGLKLIHISKMDPMILSAISLNIAFIEYSVCKEMTKGPRDYYNIDQPSKTHIHPKIIVNVFVLYN